jgi:hypothetical protein
MKSFQAHLYTVEGQNHVIDEVWDYCFAWFFHEPVDTTNLPVSFHASKPDSRIFIRVAQ